ELDANAVVARRCLGGYPGIGLVVEQHVRLRRLRPRRRGSRKQIGVHREDGGHRRRCRALLLGGAARASREYRYTTREQWGPAPRTETKTHLLLSWKL